MRLAELFDGQTWALTWIALRRFRKDRRARRLVAAVALTAAGLLLAPVVAVALIAGAALDPQMFPSLSLFLGLAIGFAFRSVMRGSRRDAALEKAALAVPIELRNELLEITYWLAVLLRRCSSEFALLKEMPPEIQIVTRRVLIDKLKEAGTWERIPAPVRDLLLKPDGHWTAEERGFVVQRFECLAVLRWVVREDATLRLLSLAPRYKYKQAVELVEDTAWARSAFVRAPAELTARANSANSFMERCWVEGVVRGLVPVDAEMRERANEYARRIAADRESTDVLYGTRTVAELAEGELREAHRRASLRVRLLRGILAEIETGYAPDRVAGVIVEGIPGAT